MTTEMSRWRPMPQLHDMLQDMGDDTDPGGFGHTVIGDLGKVRPRAPATPWDQDTQVIDMDESPLDRKPLHIVLRYLTGSHQAYADQAAALDLIRRCTSDMEQDRIALEVLGELAHPDEIDTRCPFLRAFDASAQADVVLDVDGDPTTWELLALDHVIRWIVALDRFYDAVMEGR